MATYKFVIPRMVRDPIVPKREVEFTELWELKWRGRVILLMQAESSHGNKFGLVVGFRTTPKLEGEKAGDELEIEKVSDHNRYVVELFARRILQGPISFTQD